VPILIDGHNLIGRLSALSLKDPDDEEKLVRLLKSYRARTGKKVTVVFDPGGPFSLPRRRRVGGIEVVFAPHGSSADAVIVRRISEKRNPRDWLVITSDAELADQAARQGARVKSAKSFATELAGLRNGSPNSTLKEAPSLSSKEVEEWLALFEGRDARDVVA
jgi:predicted RNA-binding protein with PIN domain